MYSLHPDQSIEHPENNLWIIEADDPNLDSRLINAIVHGGLKSLLYHVSLVMRKPDFDLCKIKGADQLHSNCKADQRLCFHYMASTIPLLPKSEISSV